MIYTGGISEFFEVGFGNVVGEDFQELEAHFGVRQALPRRQFSRNVGNRRGNVEAAVGRKPLGNRFRKRQFFALSACAYVFHFKPVCSVFFIGNLRRVNGALHWSETFFSNAKFEKRTALRRGAETICRAQTPRGARSPPRRRLQARCRPKS